MNTSHLKYPLFILHLCIWGACTPSDESTKNNFAHLTTDCIIHETPYTLNQNLLNYQELHNWQNDKYKEVILLDVRPDSLYQKGHLKNALQIWRPDIESNQFPYKGMMLEKEALEKVMSRLGASSNSAIVIYDDNGNVDAARLWWMLTTYGHPNTYLLNGGFQNAQAADITTATSPLKEKHFFFAQQEQTQLKANKTDVLKALKDSNTILLDCRTLEEFTGEHIKKNAFRAGHIPQAIHLNYTETIAYNKRYQFKTQTALLERFKALPKHKKIIIYCQSGVRSAHSTFVLHKLLGFPHVANYDGSWIEWSYDKSLPIEKIL